MENFKIYEKMGEIDFASFIEKAGNGGWPKNKRYTVVQNGIEFKVGTYWAKGDEKINGHYDAYSAINSIYVRQLRESEILWETDGGPQYADPEFDTSKLTALGDVEMKRRINFLAAVSNLLNNQATMEAIVAAATKKKNGTLHINRVVKIASSGIADWQDRVFAIVARAKNDKTLSITIDEILCREGDNDAWANDFISTYHEGLPISKALKEVFD